jgi:ABC-2 type transport system permease protein
MRKEFVQIRRDTRSLAIAVAMPVMLLIIYGYGVSSDIDRIPLGTVDWSKTAASRDLIGAFTRSGYFVPTMSSDRYGDIQAALDRRRIKVGLIVPWDYARNLGRGGAARVQVLLDGADPTTANVAGAYAEAIVQSRSAQVAVEVYRRRGMGGRPRGVPPIDGRVRVWYNEDLRSTNYIVPGLIAIILMMTSALLTSGTIARERERGTIEQLVASPLLSRELMFGKIAAYSVLAIVDVALVVLVGTLWFRVPLRGSLLLLAGASALFLMAALGLGLLFSARMPTQQTALTAALMVTMVPSILLSGFYYPIRSMPAVIQLVTTIVPARYFMVITRGIFLKGVGFGELWPQFVPLTLYGALILFGAVRSFKKRL